MKISIGSDHAGWKDKEWAAKYVRSLGHEVADEGTGSEDSCDYPDYAERVACAVAAGRAERGILICGTGVGMSMAANKVKGIRAAACQCVEAARLSRLHNDANVLCLGARITKPDEMREIVAVWLSAGFEGGRHLRRVQKIAQLDERERC